MKREHTIFYYVASGVWDVIDRAEVKLPDEQFGAAGSAHYNAAVLAMPWAERARWTRLMQTVERIEAWRAVEIIPSQPAWLPLGLPM